MDIKETILERIRIEQYIGQFTKLSGDRRRYRGLCPFHQEKTPSFHVDPQKAFYYCFGCGRGGDIFRFVMDYHNLDFLHALKKLAEFANIDYRDHRTFSKNERDRQLYYLIYRILNANFMSLLGDKEKGVAAQQYLIKERKLNPAAIEKFRLGYFSDYTQGWLTLLLKKISREWQNLAKKNMRKDKGFSEIELIKKLTETGLLLDSSYSGKWSPFSGRVIFPLIDTNGRICGFGGRLLRSDKKKPKYLNGRETSIFKKKKFLYGLEQNRESMRETKQAVLVEGYLDVIALWQAQFPYACAPLGSAVNLDQLQILSHDVSVIYLLFDGDPAGRASMLRLANLVLNSTLNLQIKVVIIPPQTDPCDLAEKISQQRIKDQLFPAAILVEHYFLLETMQPNRFINQWEQEREWTLKNLKKFWSEAYRYYSGKLTPPEAENLYPRGVDKIQVINRLFENLREISQKSQQIILLEEAGKFLGLENQVLVDRWQDYNRLFPSADNSKKRIENERQHLMAEMDLSTRGSRLKGSQLAVPLQPRAGNQPKEQKIIRIEREIIFYLLFFPSLWSDANESLYKKILEIRLEDYSAKILFRYLEMLFLQKKQWVGKDLLAFHLDDETKVLFNMMKEKHTIANIKISQAAEIIADLLDQLEEAKLEKDLSAVFNQKDFADDREQGDRGNHPQKLQRLNELREKIRSKETVIG